jgi:hypothetical protein
MAQLQIITGSIPNAINDLVGNKGIFNIAWLKKDTRKYLENSKTNPNYNKHTIYRKGNFRLGVSKNLAGKKRTTNIGKYMIAYDMKKQGYRNIRYNTIEKITVNKQTYEIKVIDEKHFRLAYIQKKKGK